MVALIIPVRNGGALFGECLEAIKAQTLQPDRLLMMDSCSTDDSAALAQSAGFEIENVPNGTFDHGGTRARAVEMVDDEIVVFLTQDAVLDRPDSLARLVQAFDNPKVGAAYGRQAPHHDADPLATDARLKNYGTEGYVADMGSAYPQGIRKAYMSNSFGAYRRAALLGVGNFPAKLILGEDFVTSGRMLKAGWKLAYVPEAVARHSHNYRLGEEFSRYFDIGVLHAEQPWMLTDFGSVEGEGVKFAIGQLRNLWTKGHGRLIPRSAAYSAAKFIGYKLGRMHRKLGPNLSRRMAMHKGYFAGPAGGQANARPR